MHTAPLFSVARGALARALRTSFGLDLDLLDQGRAEAFLAKWTDRAGIEGAQARPDLCALSSGDRGEPGVASALPFLPLVLAQAAHAAGDQPVRIWMAGAATGSGEACLDNVLSLSRQLPHGAEIVATDTDTVALAELQPASVRGVSLAFGVANPAVGRRPDGQFHLVICRDLLRFVHRSAIDGTWETLGEALALGGALLVKANDPLPGTASRLEAAWHNGARVYRSQPVLQVDDLLRRGWAALAHGDLDAALDLALDLVEEVPNNAAARVLAARALQAAGRPWTARKHIQIAQLLEPAAVVPAVVKAELDEALGRVEEAERSRDYAGTVSDARLPEAPLPLAESLPAPAPANNTFAF